MTPYKDTSKWNPHAIWRGIILGRESIVEFRRSMEKGGTINDFLTAMRVDTSGQYGFVSPVGTIIGQISRPINFGKGVYYGVRNKLERPWDY